MGLMLFSSPEQSSERGIALPSVSTLALALAKFSSFTLMFSDVIVPKPTDRFTVIMFGMMIDIGPEIYQALFPPLAMTYRSRLP